MVQTNVQQVNAETFANNTADINTDKVVVGSQDAVDGANTDTSGTKGSGQQTTPEETTVDPVAQKGLDQSQAVIDSVSQTFTDTTGQPITGSQSATDIVDDPSSFLTPEMTMTGQQPVIDADAEGTTLDGSNYQVDEGGLAVDVVAPEATVIDPDSIPQNTGPETYSVETSADQVEDMAFDAATGTVPDEAIITAPQIDLKGIGTGYNEDGTVNYTGQAVTAFATQNISRVIDTSTVSGKLLAQELGQGNYIDAKATALGQMALISEQFVGPNGEPKIPAWAQGVAREVSRIAAFKGVTGTAATASLAQALMEASMPLAESEAKFFQTLTLENLDNRQEMTINKANVLARMDLANADNNLKAAIENSKNFMAMSLENLSNEQQMRVVETQARVQSILEDVKAVNTQRMFTAEAANDFTKFYDELNTNIKIVNAKQVQEMAKYTAGEINDAAKFNAELENNREQFYTNMQYNVDVANQKWRQAVTVDNARFAFEAAAIDVQNMFKISSEAQNQLWDRVDSLLDYIWKSSETSLDREYRIEEARITGKATRAAGTASAIGSVVGAIGGAIIM